jgi:integrase
MASTEKRRGRDGKATWQARWRDPDGRQRKRTFARKSDAERFLTGIESDKLRGAYIAPDAGRVTFGECACQWAAIQHHRPMTVDQVERHLRLYILPSLGHRPVAAVRPSEVQALVKGLSERLAPSTVTVVYKRVTAIFAAAVRDRRIAASPCVGITLPRRHKPKVEPLATDAVHALVDAMPGRYKALVMLAAGTGLRQGECFGLDLAHVDFLRRQVHVTQQLVSVPRRPAYLGPPKTEASIRTVPLPTVVGEGLAAHVGAYPPGQWQLVFTTPTGAPIYRGGPWAQAWGQAVRRAGLKPGTRFHDLRHYFASLLVHHGESVKVVQARLGHASASETLDTYSHLWPDSEDRTREAVDLALGAGVPLVCPERSAEQ